MSEGRIAERRAFAEALLAALSAREQMQTDLARDLGVSQVTISDWVNTKREPKPAIVFRMEELLKLPPGHLSRHLGFFPPAAVKKGSMTFEEAVLANVEIPEEVKPGILAMYESYKTRAKKRRTRPDG